MAKEKVVRLRDPEKKSREPDSVDRDPADAAVIVAPDEKIDDRPAKTARKW